MKVGVNGGSSQQRDLQFNAERSVNCWPIFDEDGIEQASMYGSPGLNLFGSVSTGPGRATFTAASGRAFAVISSMFYEVFADGTTTARGVLLQSQGNLTIAENGLQIAICDGVNLYIYTYATNDFSRVMGSTVYVTNGDFSSGTGWTTGSGWTIGSGVATASSATSDLSTTAANTLVSGKTYTLTYTITATGGSVTPKIGGTAGVTRTAAGTFTEKIIAGATQVIAFTGAAFSGTLDNITVSDPSNGFTTASSVAFLGSYFVISVAAGSGEFQISGIYDGFAWNAIDFATAESSPDGLLRVLNVGGQLWLDGTRTIEIWALTGAFNFPFQKISGASIDSGLMSTFSAISLDNSHFWAAIDGNGAGIVYRANGFSPVRVSTEFIERRLQSAPDYSSIKFMSYQEDGHTYLMITGGGMETSLLYDLATQKWCERAYLNDDGNYELHLNADMMFAFNKTITLDRRNGNIYQQSLDFVSDNGDELARDRIFTHLIDENQRIQYRNLTVGFQVGVGNQIDPGVTPLATLYISRDGGMTWSLGSTRSIGKVGQYRTRVIWHRLGQSRIMTFRVRVTDPVKVAITGAWVNV